jgi:hypothetical protein
LEIVSIGYLVMYMCLGVCVQDSLKPGDSGLLCLEDYCVCKSTTPRGVRVPKVCKVGIMWMYVILLARVYVS